ncbi:MAG: CrcB family protein [Rhodospirillaceae bacterium]
MTALHGVVAAVAAGSAIGGVLRALVSIAFGAAWTGSAWASLAATLAVNVSGSFAIGFYAARIGPAVWSPAEARLHHFVMTGACGGYTTFSLFSLETVQLAQAGDTAAAAANVALSLATWLAAAWLGWRAGAPA